MDSSTMEEEQQVPFVLTDASSRKGVTMELATVFGSGPLIALVVLVCGVGVPLWAVIDAASRPAAAFYRAGSHKTAWIVVIVISWLIGLGFFLGGFYLLFTRRKVRRQPA
jgi:hypothetical protein